MHAREWGRGGGGVGGAVLEKLYNILLSYTKLLHHPTLLSFATESAGRIVFCDSNIFVSKHSTV